MRKIEEVVRELKHTSVGRDEIDRLADEILEIHKAEKEPCEDAISRQAAIDAIVNIPSEVQNKDIPLTNQYDGATFRQIEILGILEALPPVSPTRPKGHWIEDIDMSRKWDKVRFYCSECGRWQTYGKTELCQKCGANMR